MSFLRSFLGRRQFLISLISSIVALAFGRAYDLLFKGSVAEASETPSNGINRSLRGIVAYYSGAGNTAKVAGAIYKGMRSVIACDVAPIDRINPSDIARYDVMAVGSPNWFKREPANMKIFLYDMPRMDGKHCILFATHGDTPHAQFWSMSRNILKKGMTIIGWNDWYGSDLLHGTQPDGEWGHPDEIDLAEAEEFGRQMAEHSIKIYAGDKTLIPEIPTPHKGADSMWAPELNELGNISFAAPHSIFIPQFDLTKCVYPRCDRCMGNCPVNAIDFSVIVSSGSILSKDPTVSPLILKEACQHCGGLCERVCLYDAITYLGEKMDSVFNMKKCTYPECTACVDNCPQDAIDFSVIPPIVHRRCEGGDTICFDVCPENAIEYPSRRGGGETPAHAELEALKEKGDEASYWASHYPPDYRPLIRLKDIGSKGDVMSFTIYPRVVINRELWPYHMNEG